MDIFLHLEVLVLARLVYTFSVSPLSDAIYWLNTARLGTEWVLGTLDLSNTRALLAIMGWVLRNHLCSASLTDSTANLALSIVTPANNAINRLWTASCYTHLLVMTVRAGITSRSSWSGDLISLALDVLTLGILVASSVARPAANTVDWLSAASHCAVLVVVGIWATLAAVSSLSSDDVVSAPQNLSKLILLVTGTIV